MKNKFDPEKHYKVCIRGHRFDTCPAPSVLPGHFLPDTIDHFDKLSMEKEYAVFVVDDPQNGEYPFHWAGSFRIPMGALRQNPPQEI